MSENIDKYLVLAAGSATDIALVGTYTSRGAALTAMRWDVSDLAHKIAGKSWEDFPGPDELPKFCERHGLLYRQTEEGAVLKDKDNVYYWIAAPLPDINAPAEKNAFADVQAMDQGFDKLTLAFMDEYESDRRESGRKEIVRGLSDLASNYGTDPKAVSVISDVLITLCGWRLETLIEKAKQIPDDTIRKLDKENEDLFGQIWTEVLDTLRKEEKHGNTEAE